MKIWTNILIVVLLIAVGCKAKDPGGDFSRDGVSFSYPSGWSITEQDDMDGIGYYLAVEKSGFDASGLVTLTWVDIVVDRNEYIQTIQEEITDQPFMDNLKFQPEVEGTFGEMPALSSEFTSKTMGIKHDGVIYVFEHEGKTYSVIKQEAREDHQKNKEGFDLIESTFKVK